MKFRQDFVNKSHANQSHAAQATNIHLSKAGSLAAAILMVTGIAGVSQARAELVIEPTQQQVTITKQKNANNNIAFNNDAFNNDVNQAHNTTTPTDTSVIKLMQVMHIDEQIESIVNGQQAAIDAINTQTQSQQDNQSQQSSDKPLNKRQRELQKQIQSVLGQYAKIMSNGIGDATDEPTLTAAYISAAKTYYTQAEVDAQIGFYDTAMDQSILAKQPQITADFLKQSLPKDTSETEAKIEELLPQMKQIIKGLF